MNLKKRINDMDMNKRIYGVLAISFFLLGVVLILIGLNQEKNIENFKIKQIESIENTSSLFRSVGASGDYIPNEEKLSFQQIMETDGEGSYIMEGTIIQNINITYDEKEKYNGFVVRPKGINYNTAVLLISNNEYVGDYDDSYDDEYDFLKLTEGMKISFRTRLPEKGTFTNKDNNIFEMYVFPSLSSIEQS